MIFWIFKLDIPVGVTATLCIPDEAVSCMMDGKNIHRKNDSIKSR